MKVAIIKYNAGNVRSVAFAIERLGITPLITTDPMEIISADRIIFPGVGEAASAMRYLQDHKLDQLIRNLRQPVLGICLGMQLLCKSSEEGSTSCLGIFSQVVKRFNGDFKVPHIGWNNIATHDVGLFKGVKVNEHMYFVHSYYADVNEDTIATTNYSICYSSALQKNNFYGVQFHPEKSGEAGQAILNNFINIR